MCRQIIVSIKLSLIVGLILAAGIGLTIPSALFVNGGISDIHEYSISAVKLFMCVFIGTLTILLGSLLCVVLMYNSQKKLLDSIHGNISRDTGDEIVALIPDFKVLIIFLERLGSKRNKEL